jgi:hypothetical protein
VVHSPPRRRNWESNSLFLENDHRLEQGCAAGTSLHPESVTGRMLVLSQVDLLCAEVASQLSTVASAER